MSIKDKLLQTFGLDLEGIALIAALGKHVNSAYKAAAERVVDSPIAREWMKLGVHPERIIDYERALLSGQKPDAKDFTQPKVLGNAFPALSPEKLQTLHAQQQALSQESFCMIAETTVGVDEPAPAFQQAAEKEYRAMDALVHIDDDGVQAVINQKYDQTEPVAVDGDLFVQKPDWTARDEQTAEIFFHYMLNSVARGSDNNIVVRDVAEGTIVNRALQERYAALNLHRPVKFPILTNAQVEREGYMYNLMLSERSNDGADEGAALSDPFGGVMRFHTVAPSKMDLAQLEQSFGKKFAQIPPSARAAQASSLKL